MRALNKWTVAISSRFASFSFNPVVYFRTKKKLQVAFFWFVGLYGFFFYFCSFFYLFFFFWRLDGQQNNQQIYLQIDFLSYKLWFNYNKKNNQCIMSFKFWYFHKSSSKGGLIYSSKFAATIGPYSYETRRYKHNYLPLLQRPSKNAKWPVPCCCGCWSSFLKIYGFICVILYTKFPFQL